MPTATRKIIYARYSCDKQRPESCDDQVRKCRQGLASRNIPTTEVEELRDEAISGRTEDRPAFQRLRQLILAGEVALLVVDDQLRLSREDVRPIVLDLVARGGRFISISENIDTSVKGWKFHLACNEMRSSVNNEERTSQVRRGLEGRVLDGDGSAGDFCYGYVSEFADPNWQDLLAQGQRPRKKIVIQPEQAAVVKQIFAWFLGGVSVCEITRRLNRLGAVKGSKGKKQSWSHAMVRRMLTNPKYVGRWVYGATESFRDSTGKKRKIPATWNHPVQSHRPHLALISQEDWDRVQERLAAQVKEFAGRFGRGQSRRHGRDINPVDPLAGLVFCGHCGSRMKLTGYKGSYHCMKCPGHENGICDNARWFAVQKLREPLIRHLLHTCAACPEWVTAVVVAAREEVQRQIESHPSELATAKAQLAELRQQASNLATAIAQGAGFSTAVRTELERIEREQRTLESKIAALEQAKPILTELPSVDTVRQGLAELARGWNADHPDLARILRSIYGKVRVFVPKQHKVAPFELKFRLDGLGLLQVLFRERLAREFPLTVEADSPEITVRIGVSRMETQAPTIHRLRQAGTSWKKIASAVGLSLGKTQLAYKLFGPDGTMVTQ